MAALSIHAGTTARARILEEGFHPELFKVMVGASGGPKWFILHGLDQFLFGEFFAGRQQQLLTLGSSAGAWRLSCLATANPVASIDRLAELYSQERYSDQPDPGEVSDQARTMLATVLGESGAREIADNKVFRTHVITDRCRLIGDGAGKFSQAITLSASAACNSISRRSLGWFFERTIFSNMGNLSPWTRLADLPTTVAELTATNVFDVLIASGSIPFVLEGVRNIEGASPGLYWDGGITDYHFDLPFLGGEGLVLYPHFQGRVVPGWFDKHVPWRRAHASNYHNVVILAPSPELIAELPNGKLSDRTDFENFDYHRRRDIFRNVLEAGRRLADEFQTLVEHGVQPDQVRPIGNIV